MKTTRFYSIIFAVLLIAAGCGNEVAPEPAPMATAVPDHCIELTLGGLNPTLRSRTSIRGEDIYNENLVSSVDCFFYPDGGTGSDAVFVALGRGAEVVAEGDSSAYKVRVFFTDGDAQRMFGSTVSGTCKVFVVCNSPSSYGEHTSVADLKEVVVENDFSMQTIQDYFLMSAVEPGTITLTTEEVNSETVRSATGRVEVERAAAKIQLFLAIPDSLLDDDDVIWEPVLDSPIYAEMANAVKKGKVDGTYSAQNADYVNYPARLMTEMDPGDLIAGKTEYKYTSVPFYSFPVTWSDLSEYAPTLIFRMTWKIRDSQGGGERAYQVSPNLGGLRFERNHNYRTFVKVKSLGGLDKQANVYIADCDYQVMDWINVDATAGGQGEIQGEIQTYSYLVVDQPNLELYNSPTGNFTYISSSPLGVSADSSHVTKVKYLKLNTSTKKVEADSLVNPTASQLSTAGITVDWTSTPGIVTITHSLDAVYVQWKIEAILFNRDGSYENISMTQSPPIFLETRDGDNAFIDGYFRHVSPAPFANAWQFANYYEGWNGYYRSASYFRGFGNNYNTPQAGYGWIGTYPGASTTYYNNGLTSYVVWTPYGNMFSTPSNSNLTMDKLTAIYLSSFSSSNDSYTVDVVNGNSTTTTHPKYRIGDPRVDNDFTGSPKLVDYLTGMGAAPAQNNYEYRERIRYNNSNTYFYVYKYTVTTQAWGELADRVKIGNTDHDENNIIAPYFLVNSAYTSQIGTDGYGLDFETAKKKCATYQEGGFPAGRWRLPTEAEIMYVVSRQEDGTIPTLFNDNSGSCYWAASGYYWTEGKLYKNTSNYADGACRCVYDAWYWGDEPVEAAHHVYTPMP